MTEAEARRGATIAVAGVRVTPLQRARVRRFGPHGAFVQAELRAVGVVIERDGVETTWWL